MWLSKAPLVRNYSGWLWTESGFEVRSAAWPSALGCQGRAVITLSARMLPWLTSVHFFPLFTEILPPQYSNKLLKTNEEGYYALCWKSCCYVTQEPFAIKMKYIMWPFLCLFSIFFPQEVGMNAAFSETEESNAVLIFQSHIPASLTWFSPPIRALGRGLGCGWQL